MGQAGHRKDGKLLPAHQGVETVNGRKSGLYELGRIVDGIMEEVSARSMKDVGKVMSKVMPLVRGRIDGASVNRIVQQKLKDN